MTLENDQLLYELIHEALSSRMKFLMIHTETPDRLIYFIAVIPFIAVHVDKLLGIIVKKYLGLFCVNLLQWR